MGVANGKRIAAYSAMFNLTLLIVKAVLALYSGSAAVFSEALRIARYEWRRSKELNSPSLMADSKNWLSDLALSGVEMDTLYVKERFEGKGPEYVLSDAGIEVRYTDKHL